MRRDHVQGDSQGLDAGEVDRIGGGSGEINRDCVVSDAGNVPRGAAPASASAPAARGARSSVLDQLQLVVREYFGDDRRRGGHAAVRLTDGVIDIVEVR